jgi:uncharacterized delta-60 repeat protein
VDATKQVERESDRKPSANPGSWKNADMPRAWIVVGASLLACASASAAPSDPDLSFGQDGIVSMQTNKACMRGCVEFGGSYADALALQPDGGIILGGYNVYLGAPDRGEARVPGAIVRLRPDGELDTTFGGAGGILDVPLAVWDVKADAFGGLLVTGEAKGGRVGMQRFAANGALDTSFGWGGIELLPPFASEKKPDRSRGLLGFARVAVPPTDFTAGTWWLAIKRLRSSGQRDPRFGHDGYAVLPNAQEATPLGVIVQRDGGVIVGFRGAEDHSEAQEGRKRSPKISRSFIVRLTSAGKLDRRFGKRGIARLPFKGVARSVLMTARGGHLLVTAGGESNGIEDLALVDYTGAGHLDPSFGKAGVARMGFPGGERFLAVSPRAIAFDAVGDATVVGEHRIRTVDTPAGDAFIARFTPRGRDCSFGADGLLVDERFTAANAVAVQPDGRIVVAGGAGRFIAARYLGTGPPHTCPGG